MFTPGSNIVGVEDHPDNAGLACWLVGLPPLDGGRVLYDLTGKTGGAVLTGGAAWAGTPSGLSLDGSTGYAATAATACPAGGGTAAITASFRSVGNEPFVFCQGIDSVDANTAFRLEMYSGQLYLTAGDGVSSSVQISASFAPLPGVTYRIVGSFSAAGVKLAVNGAVAAASASPAGGLLPPSPVWLGAAEARSGASGRRLNGVVADARVQSGFAASAAWIARDYEWSQDPHRDPRLRRTSTRSLFGVSGGVPASPFVPAFAPGWGW